MIKEIEAIWEKLDEALDGVGDDRHYIETIKEMIDELGMRLDAAKEDGIEVESDE